MTMNSTAHLPRPADPKQMSEWTRTAFTVDAVVYYPKRQIIGVIGARVAIYLPGGGERGVWYPLFRKSNGDPDILNPRTTEYGACKRAMEAAGVKVKP